MILREVYAGCFEVDGPLQEGFEFPVGGGLCNFESKPWKIRIDFANANQAFFEKLEQRISALSDSAEARSSLAKAYAGINPEILVKLMAFTQTFERLRKAQNLNIIARNDAYESAEGTTVDLSYMLRNRLAMCSEMSLVAKRCMEQHGVDCRVFSGYFMNGSKEEDAIRFGNFHTFLIIKNGEEELVFDPTNPNTTSGGRDAPRILRPSVSFEKTFRERQITNSVMIACKDVATEDIWYYGVGDGANLLEEDFIHFPPTQPESRMPD